MVAQIITKTLVPADDTDLLDLDTVKEDLLITTGDKDAYIKRLIKRISAAAATHCNRVFQVQTYEDEFWLQLDPYPWQVPGSIIPLQLSQWPLAVVASTSSAAPPIKPTLAAIQGGALSAAIYYARITFNSPTGESAPSLEAAVIVPGGYALRITAPPTPPASQSATSWNAYVGSQSFGETLQADDIPLGQDLIISTLANGEPPPNYITVVQNGQPLCEGTDFLVDEDKGRLQRIDLVGYTRRWWTLPIVVDYQAGYPTLPDDVTAAAFEMFRSDYFRRGRDPLLRSANVPNVLERQWWIAQGPGNTGALTPYADDLLSNYRVPVVS